MRIHRYAVLALVLMAAASVAWSAQKGWERWEQVGEGRLENTRASFTYRVAWRPARDVQVKVTHKSTLLLGVTLLDDRDRVVARNTGAGEVLVSFPSSAGYRGNHFTIKVESVGALGEYQVYLRRFIDNRDERDERDPPRYGGRPYLARDRAYDLSGSWRLEDTRLFRDAYATIEQNGSRARITLRDGDERAGRVLWRGDGRVRGRVLTFMWSYGGDRGEAEFELQSDGRLLGEFRWDNGRRVDRARWSPVDRNLSGFYRIDGSRLFRGAYATVEQEGSRARITIHESGDRDSRALWRGDGRVEGDQLTFDWQHDGRRGEARLERRSDGRLEGEFRWDRERERVTWTPSRPRPGGDRDDRYQRDDRNTGSRYGGRPYLERYRAYDLSGSWRLDEGRLFPNAYATIEQSGSRARLTIRRGPGRDAPVLWRGDGTVRERELSFDWRHDGKRGEARFELQAQGSLSGEFRWDGGREVDRIQWQPQR